MKYVKMKKVLLFAGSIILGTSCVNENRIGTYQPHPNVNGIGVINTSTGEIFTYDPRQKVWFRGAPEIIEERISDYK